MLRVNIRAMSKESIGFMQWVSVPKTADTVVSVHVSGPGSQKIVRYKCLLTEERPHEWMAVSKEGAAVSKITILDH